MTEGVFYDQSVGEYAIQVVLDSTEARNIAYALGLHDKGAQDLIAWADETDSRNLAERNSWDDITKENEA